MSFGPSTYVNLVSETTRGQERLVLQYIGPRDDFDIIIVGSGIGGGILADDLAERLGSSKRILVLEAGSFVYPTHVYNVCRFPNSSVARHFGCDTFWQSGSSNDQFFIGEKPQLAFGGRSIFWSGLIPSIQPWELAFFPSRVRHDLDAGLLDHAGELMNESRSMGATARAIVAELQRSPLAQDFVIRETPRALHQPYLTAEGAPQQDTFTEPTGVFNTAELLINQAGLTPGISHGDGPGLQLLLNQYVEDVQNHGSHFVLVARNTLNGQLRFFRAATVVLAGGSIESPKLLRRSSMYPWLPESVKQLLGRGLTDHPTTNEMTAYVTHIGPVAIPRSAHAKIIFYSRGLPDSSHPDQIRYPFNVEMNINHEYWHLRDNDPNDPNRNDPGAFSTRDSHGPSRVDIKFSFGNCLDDANEVTPAPPFGYVPEVRMRNLKWIDHLRDSRFPALAGWRKDYDGIFDVLNGVMDRVFAQFQRDGAPAGAAEGARFGQGGKGFGWGTVHHAAGSLRMPYRAGRNTPFESSSVVDEDLRVVGTQHLYVCDMSVMPFSSAANPVRTLAALALRLSRHFG
jgi:choline dehydrogenase-like flavoprotein